MLAFLILNHAPPPTVLFRQQFAARGVRLIQQGRSVEVQDVEKERDGAAETFHRVLKADRSLVGRQNDGFTIQYHGGHIHNC